MAGAETMLATVSGYPADSETGRCHYNGVVQWWSTGGMTCNQGLDGFYHGQFDSCGGGSGSVVYDVRTKRAVGIYVANRVYAVGGCMYNMVTRIRDTATGTVNGGIGVSLKLLSSTGQTDSTEI